MKNSWTMAVSVAELPIPLPSAAPGSPVVLPDFKNTLLFALAAGAKSLKKLAQFVTASSKYLTGPGDLVFEEAACTIVDHNNKKIISRTR